MSRRWRRQEREELEGKKEEGGGVSVADVGVEGG